MNERTIIVGDIHGCIDEFQELLKKTDFTQGKDRLILVGDLISKGPYPFETLQEARKCNAEIVMGNHELSFIHYLRTGENPYPGFELLRKKMSPQLAQWLNWLENLPLYIETPEFLVVHAGIEPLKHPSETKASLLTSIRLWDNKLPWFDFYKDKKLIVFGHWAKKGLVLKDNVIGLDTGCVYGKALSAVILPERQVVQVRAKEVYKSI